MKMMMNELSRIASKPNKALEWIKLLKETSSPIIIFTIGAAGRDNYRILTEHGIQITCFADNSEKRQGVTEIDSRIIDVISFHDLMTRYDNAYVVVPYKRVQAEITDQLISADFRKEKIVVVDFETISATLASIDLYEKSYGLLADERSREVFTDRMNFIFTSDETYLGRTRDDITQMYFDKSVISLTDNEIVIDGGGYTGDTLINYTNIFKSYERYYLCEPDAIRMKAAENNVSDYPNVDFIPLGLWSHKDTLRFSANGDSSGRIVEYGDIQIEVDSIDNILGGAVCTFIKMDIEVPRSKL